MARLIGQMTTAVWFSALATDRGDRAAAKIPQFHDLRQNSRALLFETGEGVRQRTPPLLTYHYARIETTKKKSARSSPAGRTPGLRREVAPVADLIVPVDWPYSAEHRSRGSARVWTFFTIQD